MSDPSPAGPSAGRPSAAFSLAVALGAVVVCALACLGLAVGAPHSARSWVLAVSVTYGVLLSAGVAWATYAGRRHGDERRSLRGAQAENGELAARVGQLEAEAETAQGRVARLVSDAEQVRAELEAARAESERLLTRLGEVEADASCLAEQAIPELVKQLTSGASAGTALAETPKLVEPTHQRVLKVFADELAIGERLRAATLAACANAAGRVQALSTSMLADLRDMENRYDEDVLGDLLKLDHSTAQAGRLADSIAVLTGGRSGRRWTKPIIMESILRGAMGRINAYERVRLHSTSTVAVVGYAAEGVMHALAELMDNATKFSAPTEMVHVYVEELNAGVMISIEDAGLVMSSAALRRAQHAVSNDPLNLGTLSGTRLGLAVVGGLARKHGLNVSFRPSSRGGTGVLVLIPQPLITRPRTDEDRRNPRAADGGRARGADPKTATGTAVQTGPAGLPVRESGAAVPAPRQALPAEPRVPAAAPAAAGAGEEDVPGILTDEELYTLPKRVRGKTMADAGHPVEPQRPATTPTPPTGNLGARFGAFVAASKRQSEARSSAPAPRTDDAS
jgi:signal transduction histidine kinase